MPKNIDERPLEFGKYKGLSPDEVAEFDGSYIVWMYENVRPTPCSKELYEGCRMDEDESMEDLFPGDRITGRLSDD